MNITFSRARDFYIYTKQGKRLVDLDLAQGRAVFGHKSKGLIACIKRELDKGMLFSHYNANIWRIRFLKSLQKLFPLHSILTLSTCFSLSDLSVFVEDVSYAAVWRPYTKHSHTIGSEALVFCVLPLPWDPPIVVCMYHSQKHTEEQARDNYDNIKRIFFEKEQKTISEVTVSSVLYAALTNVTNLLLRYGLKERPLSKLCKNRGDIFVVDTLRNCEKRNRDDINKKNIIKHVPHKKKHKNHILMLPKGWNKDGIYICMPPMDTQRYSKIKEIFLNCGFLLPSQRGVITLPCFFTKKELEMWNMLIFDINEKKL